MSHLSKSEYMDRIVLHKQSVKVGIQRIIDELADRAEKHDDDKFETEVFDSFYNALDKFINTKFGERNWELAMDEIGDSLFKHYSASPHHAQHYENGINGTNLLDLIEMMVDWKSASNSYGDSSFEESLRVQKKRFGIDDQLYGILTNTAIKLGYMEL